MSSRFFDWEWETFSWYLENGLFVLEDPGPLHHPVRSFAVKRNKGLSLILETNTDPDSVSSAEIHPPGTVRVTTEKVVFRNDRSMVITAEGVSPRRHTVSYSRKPPYAKGTEQAKLSSIEGVIDCAATPEYTIEWLANVPRYYHWPDSSDSTTETSKTISFPSTNGPVLTGKKTKSMKSWNSARLLLYGQECYLGIHQEDRRKGVRNTGFVLYVGCPEETFRRQVRESLSFALGTYLVYLGYSSFSGDWKLIESKAIGAYSLEKKAFRLPPMPPTPLSCTYNNGIEAGILNHIVEALLKHYDELNLQQLTWAYWHAVCAKTHIGAIHYGAAIERLQRSYLQTDTGRQKTKIIPETRWTSVADALRASLTALELPEEARTILMNKVGGLNSMPPDRITEEVFQSLSLHQSEREKRAWKRRNAAAHGQTDASNEIELYKDIKLLRLRFHPLLLAITGAANSYYDYYSLDCPNRGPKNSCSRLENCSSFILNCLFDKANPGWRSASPRSPRPPLSAPPHPCAS